MIDTGEYEPDYDAMWQELVDLDELSVFYATHEQEDCLMTDIENPAGKVAGYTAQPDAKVALINSFKEMEERLYRAIEKSERDTRGYLSYGTKGLPVADYRGLQGEHYSRRDPLVEDAVKSFMVGFMLLNRAVFQPQRIRLPEDE